jgi:predicted TIM-barrel fold metal-dependent hydrolase
VRFLWAHAGSVLSADQVDQVMDACPRLWMELAARDPWRHRSEIISGADGLLKPDWRALVLKHQDRVLVGSDPVWPVEQLDAWDQDDSGWQEIGRFLGYHRGWLAGLPPAAAQKIRLDNARRLFGLKE